MPEGKRKFIEDAARLIDARVAGLRAELAANETPEFDRMMGGKERADEGRARDRAAISEAVHCAKLIRALATGPYHRDPYTVARERLGYLKGPG